MIRRARILAEAPVKHLFERTKMQKIISTEKQEAVSLDASSKCREARGRLTTH